MQDDSGHLTKSSKLKSVHLEFLLKQQQQCTVIYKSQRTLSFFDGRNQQCFFLKTAIETMARRALGGVDKRGQQLSYLLRIQARR